MILERFFDLCLEPLRRAALEEDVAARDQRLHTFVAERLEHCLEVCALGLALAEVHAAEEREIAGHSATFAFCG
jgi:hypothetical protein